MTWFAFKGYNGGAAIDIAGAQEKEAVAFGFHGYGTEAQAEHNPNSVNFLQKFVVNGLITDYNFAKAHGQQPGGPNASLPGMARSDLSSIGQSALNIVPGVKDIGDLAHRLTEPQTWIRVGEVIAGAVILFVGLKAVTSGTPVGEATKTAAKPVKAVGKVVVPEARLGSRIAAKRIAPKTTRRVAAHREQVRKYGGKRPYRGTA